MRALRLALLLVALAALVGACARQYVMPPEQAKSSNDIDWTVESQPAAANDDPGDPERKP